MRPNDMLRRDGASIGKQVTKGVKNLRATSHSVQITVYTVPDV